MATRLAAKRALWEALPHANADEKAKAREAVTAFFKGYSLDDAEIPDADLDKAVKAAGKRK